MLPFKRKRETSQTTASSAPASCYMVSTSTGCTKIQGTTWMEELRKIVSVKRGGKTSFYSNWVCDRKWNAERVIVFQSVILQRAQGINNSAQIRKRILFRLDLWNLGAFDKLVKDTYNSAMGYLGKSCEVQNVEERHQAFLNLVLKGKLREAILFFCDI